MEPGRAAARHLAAWHGSRRVPWALLLRAAACFALRWAGLSVLVLGIALTVGAGVAALTGQSAWLPALLVAVGAPLVGVLAWNLLVPLWLLPPGRGAR